MPAIRRTTFCLPLWLCCATPAGAAAPEVLSPARIGQTLIVLVTVVAAIFALAYLARRVPGLTARPGGALKLIDALSIGARERILLIEVDGQRLVLGVSPGRIERLHVGRPDGAASFNAVLTDARGAQEMPT